MLITGFFIGFLVMAMAFLICLVAILVVQGYKPAPEVKLYKPNVVQKPQEKQFEQLHQIPKPRKLEHGPDLGGPRDVIYGFNDKN